MSVELKKFQAEYAKCMKGLEAVTSETADTLSAKIKECSSGAGEGYYALRDAILAAQSQGITGTTLNDYLRHKDVKDVVQGIKTYMAEQLNFVNDLLQLQLKAGKAVPLLTALQTGIQKDLKNRKEKSKSKSDIEDLSGKIDNDIKMLNKLLKKSIAPKHREPAKEFDSEVDKLLKATPAELKKGMENDMLPQQLNTRIVKTRLGGVGGALTKCLEQCDASKAAAEKGDKSKALAALKAATAEAKEIEKTADEYAAIYERFKLDMQNSKDNKTVLDAIDKMTRGKDKANKAVKDATAALRGATWVTS